ncbi:Aste57867_3542 [Aphanomyces stellatus]|uniref:Aste57867_3542 protein n=1 Tax=Aphanomyces stellatus TaxID=120398 RepID=A0A485KAZ5_9STRA|nr:hypothetical protein As57867_003531 [Aphanomyces stellatus]VFT80705.1 Aste57867_3542 [Aphanomyces stellatus]
MPLLATPPGAMALTAASSSCVLHLPKSTRSREPITLSQRFSICCIDRAANETSRVDVHAFQTLGSVIVDAELRYCFVCLDDTMGADDGPMELIAPCPCRSHVHRACLDDWRRLSDAPDAASHCSACKSAFELLDVVPIDPPVKTLNRMLALTTHLSYVVFTCLWSCAVLLLVGLVGPFVGIRAVAFASLRVYNYCVERNWRCDAAPPALRRVRNLRPVVTRKK